MNPLSILSGLSLQTKALLILLVMAIGFFCGFKVAGWFYKADEASTIKESIKVADSIAKDSKFEVKNLQESEAKTRIIYRTIKEKIEDENDNRVCFADANALSLWNEAISGENSSGSSASGEASTPDPIITTVKEVLKNATDNFEICELNSQKHNALINRVEALDGKMCVCAQ